jgi:hypothetical protein
MKCNNELRDDVECNGNEETVKTLRYKENANESFTSPEYVYVDLCQDCKDKGKINIDED